MILLLVLDLFHGTPQSVLNGINGKRKMAKKLPNPVDAHVFTDETTTPLSRMYRLPSQVKVQDSEIMVISYGVHMASSYTIYNVVCGS